MDYRHSYPATGRWLRTSPELKRATRAAAEQIADRARAIAPVDSGEYVAGIFVTDSPGRDGRVGSTVEATAPHSAAIEFGNARVRGQAVLRRAAEGA